MGNSNLKLKNSSQHLVIRNSGESDNSETTIISTLKVIHWV